MMKNKCPLRAKNKSTRQNRLSPVCLHSGAAAVLFAVIHRGV